MSASEKLRALVTDYWEDEPPEGPEAPEAIIRALPLIADVVEAAERGRDRSVLIEENVSAIEKVAWGVEDAQHLQSSLAALQEHLERSA